MAYSHKLSFRSLIAVVACFVNVFSVTPARAVVATSTFQVTATVLKACLVTTPAALAFINYTPSTPTPLAGSTSFTVICTFGTPYSLGLSPGLNTGATVTTRKMTSPTGTAGSNLLAYGLYKEAGLVTNWDNSVTGIGYIANGLVQPYTIYGSIPAGQYDAAPAIDYADTITLTLTY